MRRLRVQLDDSLSGRIARARRRADILFRRAAGKGDDRPLGKQPSTLDYTEADFIRLLIWRGVNELEQDMKDAELSEYPRREH